MALDFLQEISSTSFLFIALIVGLAVRILVTTLTSNIPPGPYGLPLIGYAPFLGKEPPFVVFSQLSKKYGDVLSLNFGGSTVIVLNSYEAIKECFVNKGEQFAGRIIDKNSFFWWVADGLGIAQDEGASWREHRRFALHTLRDFGFGKIGLEGRVQEIGGDILSELESKEGKPFYPKEIIANAAFNVVLYLTTDQHFETNDPDFILVRSSVQTILRRTQGLGIFLQSVLGKILPIKWMPNYSELAVIKKNIHGLVDKYIRKHKESFDENNLRDFIDVFLQEMKTHEKEGRKATSTFTIGRLRAVILNLLLAGTETTSNTMCWVLRILSHRPDIQKKIQQELDEVVGKERLPSILDRPNLPYTEAFILEIQRFSTVAPLGVPHSNPASASLCGFDIPSRSVIMANLWAVHNDPKTFPEPEKFDPERFLDPELRHKRRERVIPFAIGKRSCLAEALARMELFIYITMILQRFSFRPPDGDKGGFGEDNTFFRSLKEFDIIPSKRT